MTKLLHGRTVKKLDGKAIAAAVQRLCVVIGVVFVAIFVLGIVGILGLNVSASVITHYVRGYRKPTFPLWELITLAALPVLWRLLSKLSQSRYGAVKAACIGGVAFCVVLFCEAVIVALGLTSIQGFDMGRNIIAAIVKGFTAGPLLPQWVYILIPALVATWFFCNTIRNLNPQEEERRRQEDIGSRRSYRADDRVIPRDRRQY